jgi:hypothetical protein
MNCKAAAGSWTDWQQVGSVDQSFAGVDFGVGSADAVCPRSELASRNRAFSVIPKLGVSGYTLQRSQPN